MFIDEWQELGGEAMSGEKGLKRESPADQRQHGGGVGGGGTGYFGGYSGEGRADRQRASRQCE